MPPADSTYQKWPLQSCGLTFASTVFELWINLSHIHSSKNNFRTENSASGTQDISFAPSHVFPAAEFEIAKVSSRKKKKKIGVDLLPLKRKSVNGQPENNNILTTGEMSFEMIKWKRLAMSALVNETGPGYLASCCVANICTIFCSVAHGTAAVLFQAPGEEQRSFMLITLLWIAQAASLSPSRPLRVMATPSYCGDTGKTRNHQIGEGSSTCKGEGGNTRKVVSEGWHTLWCRNMYLFLNTYQLTSCLENFLHIVAKFWTNIAILKLPCCLAPLHYLTLLCSTWGQ